MNGPRRKVAKKERIMDKQKRINLKSKRKRTLIRKAIEVSEMCDLDVLIIIRDREMNKVMQYNSSPVNGCKKDDVFTIDSAIRALKEVNQTPKYYQLYSNADYKKLQLNQREGGKDEEEDSSTSKHDNKPQNTDENFEQNQEKNRLPDREQDKKVDVPA